MARGPFKHFNPWSLVTEDESGLETRWNDLFFINPNGQLTTQEFSWKFHHDLRVGMPRRRTHLPPWYDLSLVSPSDPADQPDNTCSGALDEIQNQVKDLHTLGKAVADLNKTILGMVFDEKATDESCSTLNLLVQNLRDLSDDDLYFHEGGKVTRARLARAGATLLRIKNSTLQAEGYIIRREAPWSTGPWASAEQFTPRAPMSYVQNMNEPDTAASSTPSSES